MADTLDDINLQHVLDQQTAAGYDLSAEGHGTEHAGAGPEQYGETGTGTGSASGPASAAAVATGPPTKKTRSREGCLVCRSRRIKCDNGQSTSTCAVRSIRQARRL